MYTSCMYIVVIGLVFAVIAYAGYAVFGSFAPSFTSLSHEAEEVSITETVREDTVETRIRVTTPSKAKRLAPGFLKAHSLLLFSTATATCLRKARQSRVVTGCKKALCRLPQPSTSVNPQRTAAKSASTKQTHQDSPQEKHRSTFLCGIN